MTTDRHTPLPFGGPLTSAAMNAPLGQLDAAIGLLSTAGSGGWYSQLDGTAASGQKVIPVTSTPNADAVGLNVFIGPPSGTHEEGVIASISAGVSVTLATNLTSTYSAGAPISATPAEVADARGGYATLGEKVRGGVFDVRDYGAKFDGMTDDTTAIQATIDDAGLVGGVVTMPPGSTIISAPLVISKSITLAGGGRRATVIRPSAQTFAAIRLIGAAGADLEGWALRDFSVSYGDANGGNRCTNEAAIAISLENGLGGIPYPFRGSLDRIYVDYACAGYKDLTRGFMISLRDCVFQTCTHGIYASNVVGKTTYTFGNVYVNDTTGRALEILGVSGFAWNGGAVDNAVGSGGMIVLDTSRGVFMGMDSEACILTGAVSDEGIWDILNSLVSFIGCTWIGNQLNGTQVDAGIIKTSDATSMTFQNSSIAYSTTAGNNTRAAALYVTASTTVVHFIGSELAAPVGAGGTASTDFAGKLVP